MLYKICMSMWGMLYMIYIFVVCVICGMYECILYDIRVCYVLRVVCMSTWLCYI